MKKFIVISIVVLLILGIGVVVVPLGFQSDQRSFQEVTIPGDGYKIKGYLSEGVDPQGKWIILVHGNRKNGQDHELYRVIRNNLPMEYSVLAIDLRGFGGSSGDGIKQAPNTIVRSEDLLTVENYLVNTYDVQEDQLILIGHSFGAAQVMKDAQDHNHLLVIPIGLGDWDGLIENPSAVQNYIRKFQSNTGAVLEPDVLLEEGKEFTTKSLFVECPTSPVWLLYASQDDGIQRHWIPYQSLHERCQSQINWSEIALSDHTYGTEFARLPEPLKGIYSRFSLSLLLYRLNGILSTVGM
ncbi:alpha/beta hydrolase [Chloroflexota bacterium]